MSDPVMPTEMAISQSVISVQHGTRNMAAHYRPDIDGLRALAIIPVVLFHLRFPSFSGGYVGVDVFFVISGYLITSIIYPEVRTGSFSFGAFYERRVRRLFPALFAVIASTFAIALVVLLPGDFASFCRSMGAAAVFLANVLFWKTADYFDGPAETKPLLHVWSLSVEEQFYILFPLMLLLIHRIAPRRVREVVAAIALASFVASVYYIARTPSGVFYLPIFRAWELFLGVLLALGSLPRISSHRLRDVLAVIGLSLIAFSVHRFSDQTVFPGANALLPTVGTALLIHVGDSGGSIVGRVLSVRWLVFIGLISYPLYLWHWPLIVFTNYYRMEPLLLSEKLAIVALSVLLAALTWRFIERPFRGKQGIWSRRKLFAVSGLGVGIFLVAGLGGHVGDGFPQRLPAEVIRTARVARRPEQPRCFNPKLREPLRDQACAIGSVGPPTFLLWGDSHALAVSAAVDSAARQAGVAGLFVGKPGCPSLLGVERYDRESSGCKKFNDRVVSFLEEQHGITRVVLVSRWALNALGSRYGREGGPPALLSQSGVAGNPQAFREGLDATLRYLTARGYDVIILAQVPEIGWNVPSTLARAQLYGRPAPAGPSLEEYRDRQRIVDSALTTASARYPFHVIEMTDIFCPSGTCSPERAGVLLYRDGDHLSPRGAMLLSPVIQQALARR